METLQLHKMLTVHLHIDEPQSLCRPHQGKRRSGEIRGGEFQGERLQGRVLAGGSLFLVPQDDNLARFSLYYTLMTDDGIKIDVVGEGLVAVDGTDQAPLTEAYCRCTCSTQFSVPSGDHDYLQRNLYIGGVNIKAGDTSMRFSIFQVNQI
ncbi:MULTISPECIES: DUF3237 family protein [Pseudomonas syringae group]|uniref:Uncharacterized protein n=2 Tax=Pseudomonas syringae group TaxID=136849 RepID=A0ABY1U739_PSESX|nr:MULTISPECIES: DUF3237 family protein [Pseudomonas syringae group]KWT02426.1 hypothetical protein AL046_03450 [Pseudomonas syringae pv. avii]POQ07036.1 DUF3237 domain-containing protein [Pseudomonas syringae pv. avii]SOQ09636.1 hypothetical protein NCPPB2254_02448 [Pseudomonas syringae pv. persicae]SOQ10202.1 hypothetical protein CFBP1573P_02946 [Pseudomonas syringae pv. persicae]SOS27186.1 hypothetical protein CFBP3846_02770 [Pseudomonas syringae pv. avii]